MDPHAKGWLRKYCELIDSMENSGPGLIHPSHSERDLYRLLQSSGIMYGHPVREATNSGLKINHLDPVGRMKLIFAESLIYAGSCHLEESQTSIAHDGITEQLIPEISDYFLNLYPNLYQGKITSYLKDSYYLAENLIDKRVTIQTSLVKNYLANLFHNSLLFLDVIFFGEWVGSLGSSSPKRIRKEKEQMRLTILGIMALAAQADDKLQKEERALFEFFLQSANLTPDMEKKARSVLSNIKGLSTVDVPQVDSWILRKYLLEMAILVTLADKKMNEKEQSFVNEIGYKLKLSPNEISESQLAVESFVLENWSAMHYLLGKGDVERVGNRFLVRFKGFINNNKDYVVQEIRESKELFHLLGKSRTNDLTLSEKKIVNEQLIDILKTIPTFVLIALPFTFITLPVLLSLLPKSAFPSAFHE